MSTPRILPLLALLPLIACADVEAGLDGPAPTESAPATAVAPPARGDIPALTPAALPLPSPIAAEPLDPLAPPPAVEGFDTVAAPITGTPAALPPAGRLGTTVASLGSPTEPGLWLETALVAEPTTGRVEYNGASVTLELRPSGGEPGSGSQISLEAMRALGAPLTGLPELVVFSG